MEDNINQIDCINITKPTKIQTCNELNYENQWKLIKILSYNNLSYENNNFIHNLKDFFTAIQNNLNNTKIFNQIKKYEIKNSFAPFQNQIIQKTTINITIDDDQKEIFLFLENIKRFLTKNKKFNSLIELNLIKHSNNEIHKTWQII